MTNRVRDIATGCVLFALGGVWTGLVINTIPPGTGEGDVGPRAFPLFFGVMLMILAAVLLMRTAWQGRAAEVKSGQKAAAKGRGIDPGGVMSAPIFTPLIVLAEILLYGYLLQRIGFVLATPVIILMVMIINLRIRSIPMLAGFATLLTAACWLVFEKMLGIPLANGIWINLG